MYTYPCATGIAAVVNIVSRMPGHIYPSQWSKQVAILSVPDLNGFK